MTLEQKVDALEGEIGIMKGEIKQTLVDLREFIMKQGSPFDGVGAALPSGASRTADREAPAAEGGPRVQQVFMGQEDDESEGGSDDADSATEEARASAARMREELDAVRAESRRELEAMRAEMAAQGPSEAPVVQQPAQAGGGEVDMLREELEALRAERAAQPQPAQPPPQVPQVIQIPGPTDTGEAARLRQELQAVRTQSQKELEALRAGQALQAEAIQQQASQPSQAGQPVPEGQQVVQTPQGVQPPQARQVVRTPVQAPDVAVGPAAVAAPGTPAPQVVQLPEGAVIPGEPQVTEPEPGAGVEAIGGEEIEGLSGQVPGASALDANLLANLLKWVGGLKRRLGSDQLGGLLEIYKLTGHLPPVVENLIYHLAALEALPDESSDQIFTVDDLMDSLLQLHAIVYGPGYPSRGELLDIE